MIIGNTTQRRGGDRFTRLRRSASSFATFLPVIIYSRKLSVVYVHVRNTYFALRYLRYSFFFFFFFLQGIAFPFSALPRTVEKSILEWIINLLADSSIFSPFMAMHTENFTTGTHAPLSFIRLFVIYHFYFYSYPSVRSVLFQHSSLTVNRIDRRICDVAMNQSNIRESLKEIYGNKYLIYLKI